MRRALRTARRSAAGVPARLVSGRRARRCRATSGPHGRDRSCDDGYVVADAYPAGDGDLAEHAEDRLAPLVQAGVMNRGRERVEVGDAGVGVLGREGAAGVGFGDREHGGPELDLTADPLVLLVLAG